MTNIQLKIKPTNYQGTHKEFAIQFESIFEKETIDFYCLNFNYDIVKGILYSDSVGNLRFETNYDGIFNPNKMAFCKQQLL